MTLQHRHTLSNIVRFEACVKIIDKGYVIIGNHDFRFKRIPTSVRITTGQFVNDLHHVVTNCHSGHIRNSFESYSLNECGAEVHLCVRKLPSEYKSASSKESLCRERILNPRRCYENFTKFHFDIFGLTL